MNVRIGDGPGPRGEHHGQPAGGRAHRGEGDLLDHETAQGSPLRGPAIRRRGCIRLVGAVPEAPQGPVVEQQEDERQRHEHRLGHESEPEPHADEGQAAGARPPGVGDIAPEREETEEGAKHVLPLRDPGDGLDTQRVEGEQRGHQGAAPERARHGAEDEEEQESVDDVEAQAGEVVPPRVHPVELRVGHEREPRERHPVPEVAGGEGPRDAVHGQAGADVWVLDDVPRIVQVHEAVMHQLPVD